MKDKIYQDYIHDIFTSIEEIEEFTKGLEYTIFIKDKKTINAVIRSLEVIGEASKKIPLSIQKKYPNVPWRKMAAMRDKLIHEYFAVDLKIVWQTLKEDLPVVKPLIEKITEDFSS